MMPKKQYSSLIAFVYFLNNNISGGLLAVPFVFYHAGLMFGVLLLVVVAVFTVPPLIWTLETMARAQALEDRQCTEVNLTQRLDGDTVSKCQVWINIESLPTYGIRSERKFEVDELCRLFLGRKTGLLYGWSIVIWCLLCMWYYVTVAASAWAAHIPFNSEYFQQCSDDDFRLSIHPVGVCWNTYSVCVLMYGIIVVPISMMDLTEQKIIQIVLSYVRLVAVILMVVYCLVALLSETGGEQNYDDGNSIGSSWFRVDLVGGMAVIPVISHALSCQSMIPSFVQPVADKRKLHWLLAGAIFACACVYGVVGVTVASHFKGQLVETSTLSWVPLTETGHKLVIRIMSYFIVIYPSLVMLSALPLSAVACSNYVLSLCRTSGTEPSMATKRVVRFCVVMVPLICALGVSNLVEVLKYGGLAGYLSSYIIPGLLVLKSRKVCQQIFSIRRGSLQEGKSKASSLEAVVVWDESKEAASVCALDTGSDVTSTPYTSILSKQFVVWSVLAFSVFATAATIGSIVLPIYGH